MGDIMNSQDGFTVSGTNIDEVKRNNAKSGLTYNEVKQLLAMEKGTQDEGLYNQSEITDMKKNQ